MISKKLRHLGNKGIPTWACAYAESSDALCLSSPARVLAGDLMPISMDFGGLDDAALDDVRVTVEVSTALGSDLGQPYRDPENPGDLALTWSRGVSGWIGTASLGRLSGAGSAHAAFAIDNLSVDDSVTISGHVDYMRDGWQESLDTSSTVEALSDTVLIPD